MSGILANHLTAQQREISTAFFSDGATQEEAAERFGVSRPTVARAIAAFREVCEKLGWPEPKRVKLADTRHVRSLDAALIRSI